MLHNPSVHPTGVPLRFTPAGDFFVRGNTTEGVALMNEVQQVYVLFFAIFWGAMASAQPRWKAFHWCYIHVLHVRHRLMLSMMILNLFPILFFAGALWILRCPVQDASSWTVGTVARVVFLGVLPAFSTFGFYRLWFGLVELWPDSFYQKNAEGQYVTEDDSKAVVYVTPSAGPKNVIFGIAYILAGALPLIVRCLL